MAGGGFADGGNDSSDQEAAELTISVILICIVAALAGLIFGYDVGVSGGVTTMPPFLEEFFPDVLEKMMATASNQYCVFDSQKLTLFTSSLYMAGLLSSLLAGGVTTTIGRRGSLFVGGFVFLAGTALTAAAVNLPMLIVGRILLGFGIGFTQQAAPVYLSEMAPSKWRGTLSTCFQFFITIGVIGAGLTNFGVAGMGKSGWRVALGIGGIPAAIMILGAIFIPDTPSSLIQRGMVEEARESLRRVRHAGADVEGELKGLIEHHEAIKAANQDPFKLIFQRSYRPQLVLTMLIPTFQQLTGINMIAFYGPVLFRSMGFGSEGALVGAIITGSVNIASTFVATYAVDRVGRRMLFLEAGIQIMLAEVAMAIVMAVEIGVQGTEPFSRKSAEVVLVLSCIITAGFAWSWGPLTWLIPSEILPMEVRPAGQGICIATNFLVTFVLAQSTLSILCAMKFGAFLFYAACLLLMTVFVAMFLPETKGISLQDMQHVWHKHWYWKRFVEVHDHDKSKGKSISA